MKLVEIIEILNVMVFKRHLRKNNADIKTIQEGDSFNDGFKLEFCDGINVLIGENGVGKTTILKMIYAATQWSIKQTDAGKTKRLVQYFSNSLKDSEDFKNSENKEGFCYYKVSDGTHNFVDSLSHNGIFNYDKWLGLDIQSVFIPTTEMLSHAKGFLAMNQKYNMPFDGTQIDIIVLLELQKNGTQIFVATHSYNFAKYLEIRRINKEQVMFHNLYKSRNSSSDEMQKIFIEENGVYSIDCRKLSPKTNIRIGRSISDTKKKSSLNLQVMVKSYIFCLLCIKSDHIFL